VLPGGAQAPLAGAASIALGGKKVHNARKFIRQNIKEREQSNERVKKTAMVCGCNAWSELTRDSLVGLSGCPAGGLWVLIVGWISGEDPTYPEMKRASDALWDCSAGSDLW